VLILWLLANKEHTVSESAIALDASLPCISKHLHLMYLNGILEFHREMKKIYYRLADNDLLKNQSVQGSSPWSVTKPERAFLFIRVYP
jgi:hypothetical protein